MTSGKGVPVLLVVLLCTASLGLAGAAAGILAADIALLGAVICEPPPPEPQQQGASARKAVEECQSAVNLHQQGLLTESEAAYLNSIAANDAMGGVHFGYGLLLSSKHQWNEALAAFQRALKAASPHPCIQLGIGKEQHTQQNCLVPV